jgi:hypothetical protein
MKKIALITSFCNTEEKLKVLYDNIKTIKDLGLDVMVFSHFYLPKNINNIIDYTIISKENPLIIWPEKGIIQWQLIPYNNFSIHMSIANSDYGYAVLNQIKRMASLALSMDYDSFFVVDYDLNITDYVKNILLDNKKNSFFPSKNTRDEIWGIGLRLISLDRKHLTRFKNLITKENYLFDSTDCAESWLHKSINFIPGIIEGEPLEDLIYNYKNVDFFDQSIIKGLKLFIHKIVNSEIKLFFYSFENVNNFIIKTEDFIQEFNISEFEEIELPYKEYDSFIVVHKEKEYDFTDIISKITFNTFTKTAI